MINSTLLVPEPPVLLKLSVASTTKNIANAEGTPVNCGILNFISAVASSTNASTSKVNKVKLDELSAVSLLKALSFDAHPVPLDTLSLGFNKVLFNKFL